MPKKITIENIKDFTTQEIFDFVSNHLLTQNEKALGIFGCCVLLSPNNKTCAVGCLITPEQYIKYDAKECNSMALPMLLQHIDIHLPNDIYDLLLSLQNIHDTTEAHHWRSSLETYANYKKLVFDKS